MLQIEPLLDRRPEQLSGGQRQRVAIGRALVRDAAVFLFDEPLSNLDAQLRNELRVEIKRLHQRLGSTTMIYVTHDQIEALTLADRIAVMQRLEIQQLGSPAEIYHRPANLFVAGFVGSPRMNFIEGRLERDGHRLGLRRRRPAAAARRLRLPAPAGGRRAGHARHPAGASGARGRAAPAAGASRSRWSSRWAPTASSGAATAGCRSGCGCRASGRWRPARPCRSASRPGSSRCSRRRTARGSDPQGDPDEPRRRALDPAVLAAQLRRPRPPARGAGRPRLPPGRDGRRPHRRCPTTRARSSTPMASWRRPATCRSPDLRARLDWVVDQAKTLGIVQLFMPAVPVEERDRPAGHWRALGDELAEMAERLAAKGLGARLSQPSLGAEAVPGRQPAARASVRGGGGLEARLAGRRRLAGARRGRAGGLARALSRPADLGCMSRT